MGSKDGARRPPSSFRIPLGLQMVFLSSSRGLTVHKPPPDKSGSKEFHRNDSIPNLAKKGPTTTGMINGGSLHEQKKKVGTMKPSSHHEPKNISLKKEYSRLDDLNNENTCSIMQTIK